MKPVDKKDMPKLIALIGLTVGCLGFGIYSLVGGISDASPPAPKVQKQAPSVAQSPSTDALLVEIKRLEGISDPILVRDPFTTTGGAIGVATATPAPPAPSTQPSPSPQDVAITNANRRAQTLGEMLGINVRPPKSQESDPRSSAADTVPGRTPGAVIAPLALPPPAPPELAVTGIMIPENGQGKSIAIVRVKNETRWLSVGETVGQGFVVHSIRRTESGSEVEIMDSNDNKRLFIFKVN